MTNTQSTLRTAAIGLIVGALTAGIVVAATRRGPHPARKAAAPTNPAEWTVADVVAWARDGPAAAPEDVAKALQREDIDGAALLQLDDAMLQSIGVTKMGARLRLAQAIAALRAAPVATTALATAAAAVGAAAASRSAAQTPTRTTSAPVAAAPAPSGTSEDVGADARDAIAEMVAQFRFISSPDFLELPQAQQLQVLGRADAAFRSSAAAMAHTPAAQRAELEPLVGRFGQLLTVLRARLMQQQPQPQGSVAAATTSRAVAGAPVARASEAEAGPSPREAALSQKLEALIDIVQSPELRDASGEALLSVLQRLAGHLSTLRDEIAQLPAGRQAPYNKVLDQVEGILVRMVREGTAAARAANAAAAPAPLARRDAAAGQVTQATQAGAQAAPAASAGAVAKEVAARVQQVLAALQSRDLLSLSSAQRRQMLETAAQELRAIVQAADLESLPEDAQEAVGSMITQVVSYVTKLREVSEAIDASSSTDGSAAAGPAASAASTPARASTPSSAPPRAAGRAASGASAAASEGSVGKEVAARVQQVLATLQSRDLLSMGSAQRRQMLEAAAQELRAIVSEADIKSLPAEAQEVVGSMIGQVASYVAKLREVSEAIDASSSTGAGAADASAAAKPAASGNATNGAATSTRTASSAVGTSVLERLRSQLVVMRNVVESDSFATAPEAEQVAVARKIMEQLSELRELAGGVLAPNEAEQFTLEISQFLQLLHGAIAGGNRSGNGSSAKPPQKAAADAEAHTAAARKSVNVLQRTQRLFDIIKSPQFEQAPDDRRATACSAIVAECDDLLSEAAGLPARERAEVRGVVLALRRMVASMLPGGRSEGDEAGAEDEEVEEVEEAGEEGSSDVDAEVDGGAHRFTGRDSDEESEVEGEEEELPPLAPPTPPGSDLEQELHRAARTLQSDDVLSPSELAAVASGIDRAIRANRSEWQEDARLNQFTRQVMALLQRRAQELQRPGGALAAAFAGDEGADAEEGEDEDESIAAQLHEAAATLEALPALESPADLAPYMSMLEHCRAAQPGFTVAEARAYNRMQRAVLSAAQKLRGVAANADDEAEAEEEEEMEEEAAVEARQPSAERRDTAQVNDTEMVDEE